MQFDSLSFFIFFAFCFVLYYWLPIENNKSLLLITCLVFYSCFSYSALGGLLAIVVVSWVGEAVFGKVKNKVVLFVFVLSTLLPLIVLKYFNVIPGYVLPVGISFFSLQAVSGMVDVYQGKSNQSDFTEHLLYLSFFPTVVSGPIIRKRAFLDELRKQKVFLYDDVRRGFYRIAIGFVEKFFLADRISKLVNYVYENSLEVSGAQIVVATILFGLQLYFDFAGYSHMALGMAKCFGIQIMENFERPYFSVSIKEFWRRWHISLSSWLRDYVYIPLGGSRKGTIRRYVNLIITFLVSGVWHGVGLNFLFWGFLHGVYQVVEDIISSKFGLKIDSKEKNIFLKLISMTFVFVLVDFAWLFFRAENMTTAIQMVKTVISDFKISSLFTTWWFEYGMSKIEYLVWCIIAFVIFFFDIFEERNCGIFLRLEKQKMVVRWSIYACVLFVIVMTLMIGVGNNTSSFLYQNF